MAGTLGPLFVIFGLVSALLAALVTGIGLATNRRDLISMSGKWSIWTLLSASGAVAVMEYSLLTNDFSMAYVADNSTLALPLLYKIAAMWASLEGSLILWVFVLCLYISAVAWWFSKRLDDRLLGFAMLTLFIVAAFFFFLLAGPASPFDTLSNPPLDGRGPNPPGQRGHRLRRGTAQRPGQRRHVLGDRAERFEAGHDRSVQFRTRPARGAVGQRDIVTVLAQGARVPQRHQRRPARVGQRQRHQDRRHVEPGKGVEPLTYRLQGGCSAI